MGNQTPWKLKLLRNRGGRRKKLASVRITSSSGPSAAKKKKASLDHLHPVGETDDWVG